MALMDSALAREVVCHYVLGNGRGWLIVRCSGSSLFRGFLMVDCACGSCDRDEASDQVCDDNSGRRVGEVWIIEKMGFLP
jgi:uncharacterized protein (DUF983 family)